MAESFKNTLNAVDSLWACNSSEAVFDIVAEYGRGLGFELAIIACCCPMLMSPRKSAPFHTNCPQKWVELYAQHDFMSVDPIVQLAMRSSRPFTAKTAFADGSKQAQAFRAAAVEHGLEFGWFIPVHIADRPSGLVGFGGASEVQLTVFQKLESSIVGQVAYERASLYFGDIMAETEVSISDRERAVLTLVARGKTNWEAGAALSISEYSVRDYLKALSAKLQTSNRTHTVARAMQLGLIAP